MKEPKGQIAPEERARLQEIADLDLTSLREDPELQAMAEQAARELGLPVGLVSIVLNDAQQFIAFHGLEGWMEEARGTPVEWSFCAFAVKSKKAFVVENATLEPKVKENPLVTQDGIRCYAGIPLVTHKGHAVGTLCVLGKENHDFDDSSLDRLRDMAKRVMNHLETRRQK